MYKCTGRLKCKNQGTLLSSNNKTYRHDNNWNIVENGITRHNHKNQSLVWFLYASLETGRIMCLGAAGGRPHNNFSSIYRIFTKLGHMIPLWKGKNPIYFWVIMSKIKVTITINNFFKNRVVSTW